MWTCQTQNKISAKSDP